MKYYTDYMRTFDETHLPDLDQIVLASLEYFSTTVIPKLNVHAYLRPLVIGSVGGLSTARILFENTDAVFADEGNYIEMEKRVSEIDAVYIVSASGGKHAIRIAEDMSKKNVPVFLLTNTQNSHASTFISPEFVHVFPHIREPYTYNTSTYLSILLSHSTESPLEILEHIESKVIPLLPQDFEKYESFILTVPPSYSGVRQLFETKFDELFAPVRTARSFTSEEIKHAKIVIPSTTQCVINFGVPTTPYAHIDRQIQIPLPENAGPIAMLAIGYYVIGVIQKQNEPYFKENIHVYTSTASKVFGQHVPVIVE